MLATNEKTGLRQLMRDNPSALFETVAAEHSVTCRAVVEALPDEMRKIAPGAAFLDAMADMATWGDVTFLIHTEDGIFEISGPVPPGSVGRGYFNLSGPTALHGHLRYERCAAVAFVERPFMGKPSASALFISQSGGFMFKVFVGRDESRALKTDQLEKFRALARRLAA